MNALLLATDQTFWLPPQASSNAAGVDFVFYFILWVSAIFFAIIAGCMFVFMFLYRRKTPTDAVSHVTHNTPLEIAWSVLPSILLVLMFWWGFVEFKNNRTIPSNTYDINLEARKWAFEFTYPNGIKDKDLHVAKNQPTRLIMRSQDVIHAAYIPAFRQKRDIVPGRYSELWFNPTKAGTYYMFCAEYCGTSHSDMRSSVVVHETNADFASWLENADPLKKLTPELYDEYKKDPAAFIKKYESDAAWADTAKKLKTPADMGKELYNKKGCAQCHSVDGKANTGPTWKGMWGKPVEFADGSSLSSTSEADWSNYVRESILEPGAKIVKGYGNNMAKISVTDREIDMLIAYMKSLKD